MDGTLERGEHTVLSTQSSGGPAAAERARRLLTEELGDAADGEKLYDLLLLTTELVTNGVRHAGVAEGETLDLTVAAGAGTVRVSVVDPGCDTSPSVQDVDLSVPGGMGLYLVEQISTSWGFERLDGDATCVSSELALDCRRRPPKLARP